MSLYDRDDPNQQAFRDQWNARWTPEKEAALQHKFDLMGLNGETAKRLAEEADRAKETPQ